MNIENAVTFFLNLLVKAVQLRAERADNLNQGFYHAVWNANETGEFSQVTGDYNPDDTRKVSTDYWCAGCVYCDPNGETANDTQMGYLDACDFEGETGSVTLASRRLKRARQINAVAAKGNNGKTIVGRKCDEAVSARTESAIANLVTYGKEIRAEGIMEQQEIFETQMMRMGEHDVDVMEWRNDFETWPTFGEQIRSYSRFNRHQRGW